MNDQNGSKSCWRSLKAMHEHYLAHTLNEEGKSADELIRSYREQRRLRRSFFQITNALPRAKTESELVLLEQERNFDQKIAEIRADVQRRMLADASSAKWLAMGRRDPDKDHELIPPRHWPFLHMDLENEALLGDGVAFRDLRCAIMNELAKDDPIHDALRAALPHPADAPAKRIDVKNGAPGRPSGMHLIEQEFALRRKAGRLEKTLSDQAKALADWFRITHKGIRPPTPKTIANRIRHHFRSAKAAAPSATPKIIVRD